MFWFQIFDLLISSEIDLPELRRGTARRADLRVMIDRGERGDARRTSWVHHYIQEGEAGPWLSLGRWESDYILRFHGFGDFHVSERRRSIHCSVEPDLRPATLRHLLLDQVIPLALAAHGRTVLHASAVLAGGSAIAFMGDSGAGKSTLVASFAMAGYPVVTDDSLLVTETPGAPHAVPSYPSVRLWPNAIALAEVPASLARGASGTRKRRLGRRAGLGFASEPAPLRAIFVLEPMEATTREPARVDRTPLSAREALVALVERAYRLDVSPGAPLGEEFKRLCRLAESVFMCRLSYRKHPDSLRMIKRIVQSEWLPGAASRR
jgi:hypothetical protein